jgi:hypothetical protein
MTSILKVDTIQDQDGNNIINESGDTITIGASGDTITIPSGATTTLTDGVSGDFKMNSGFGSVETAYGCRAWVNFNGTGTVAIAESGNVTSITDNGTGDYTVNFTTAMPDSNFCSLCFSGDTPAAIHSLIPSSYTPNVNDIRIATFDGSLVNLDVSLISVAIFR